MTWTRLVTALRRWFTRSFPTDPQMAKRDGLAQRVRQERIRDEAEWRRDLNRKLAEHPTYRPEIEA